MLLCPQEENKESERERERESERAQERARERVRERQRARERKREREREKKFLFTLFSVGYPVPLLPLQQAQAKFSEKGFCIWVPAMRKGLCQAGVPMSVGNQVTVLSETDHCVTKGFNRLRTLALMETGVCFSSHPLSK